MNLNSPLINHILLADDDKDHGILFSRILNRIDPGKTLSCVYDGDELFQFLEQHHVDMIFLDLRMPSKDGHQCLIDLKNHEIYKSIPVIVYSTSSSRTDIQKSFIHKADFYMVKPFNSEHLTNALESILTINWKEGSPMNKHYYMNNRFVPFTATG